jgi:hypothetical protein
VMFLVNNTTVQTLRPCKELGFTLVGLSKLRNLLSLMSSQPATDYLRQAAHFISYATFLHLKHYGSALMAPTKSAKARVHWTEEEISALLIIYMPRSTAIGQFAHDGAANEKEGDDSGAESDDESASGLAADQGPSIPGPLFPPSVIAPFIALSQTVPASTPGPSCFSESSNTALPSLPAPPPSSSSAAPFQTSSAPSAGPESAPSSSLMYMPVSQAESSSSFPRGPLSIATCVPPGPSPSSLSAPTQSISSGGISSVGISSKGKRKQSAVPDLDDHGSLKRCGPQSSGSKATPAESAILHGFQGSMNHFSDVVNLNNESQPHTILKDATSKLNGAWGTADKFTDGQKIFLLKLFRQNQGIASLYASTENSRVRRGYALTELEPYQNEIDNFDREEPEENDDDDNMYV